MRDAIRWFKCKLKPPKNDLVRNTRPTHPTMVWVQSYIAEEVIPILELIFKRRLQTWYKSRFTSVVNGGGEIPEPWFYKDNILSESGIRINILSLATARLHRASALRQSQHCNDANNTALELCLHILIPCPSPSKFNTDQLPVTVETMIYIFEGDGHAVGMCKHGLIEINGANPERVATPFWRDSICFHCFQWDQ